MVITGRSICRQAGLPSRYSTFILYIHGSRQRRMVCCCLSLGTGYKGTAQNGGQEQACCSKRDKAYPGSTAAPSVMATVPKGPILPPEVHACFLLRCFTCRDPGDCRITHSYHQPLLHTHGRAGLRGKYAVAPGPQGMLHLYVPPAHLPIWRLMYMRLHAAEPLK